MSWSCRIPGIIWLLPQLLANVPARCRSLPEPSLWFSILPAGIFTAHPALLSPLAAQSRFWAAAEVHSSCRRGLGAAGPAWQGSPEPCPRAPGTGTDPSPRAALSAPLQLQRSAARSLRAQRGARSALPVPAQNKSFALMDEPDTPGRIVITYKILLQLPLMPLFLENA